MPSINLPTEAKQDEILSKLNTGVKIIEPEFVPFNYTTRSTPTTNTNITLVDIVGEGLLDKAAIDTNGTLTRFKITIDGTVFGLFGGIDKPMGIVQESSLSPTTGLSDNVNIRVGSRSNSVKQENIATTNNFPFSVASSKIYILFGRIKFNRSLKIEITTNQSYWYAVDIGGVVKI